MGPTPAASAGGGRASIPGAFPLADAGGDDRRERVEETTETELLCEDGDFCEVRKMRTPRVHMHTCVCARLSVRSSLACACIRLACGSKR